MKIVLKMKNLYLLCLLVLMALCMGVSADATKPASKSHHKNLSNTPACIPEHQAFRESQDSLASASDSLMKCAVAGNINYDCAQDYEAVERLYKGFQTTLDNQLRPCMNPPIKSGSQVHKTHR